LAAVPKPGINVARSNPAFKANLPASPQSNPSLKASPTKCPTEPNNPVAAPATLPTTGMNVAPTPIVSVKAARISALSASLRPSLNVLDCSFCL